MTISLGRHTQENTDGACHFIAGCMASELNLERWLGHLQCRESRRSSSERRAVPCYAAGRVDADLNRTFTKHYAVYCLVTMKAVLTGKRELAKHLQGWKGGAGKTWSGSKCTRDHMT
jgi:hypothetical protein